MLIHVKNDVTKAGFEMESIAEIYEVEQQEKSKQ